MHFYCSTTKNLSIKILLWCPIVRHKKEENVFKLFPSFFQECLHWNEKYSLIDVSGEINDGLGENNFEDNFIFDADEVDPKELLRMMPRFSEPVHDAENDVVGESFSPEDFQLARDIPDLDPLEEEGEDPIMYAGTQTLRPFFIIKYSL